MARMDRCAICDYNEITGAEHLGIPAHGNGKVRLIDDEMRCEACASSIGLTLFELEKDEEEDT